MAQVQNLLDLFQMNPRDAQAAAGADAKPAPRIIPGLGAPAKPGRNAGSLLPIVPDASGQGNKHVSSSPHSSFRAKMEDSTAKLAAKGRAPKPSAPARAPAPAKAGAPKTGSEPAAPRSEEPKRAHDARDGRPARHAAKRAAQGDRDQALKPQDDDPGQANAAAPSPEAPDQADAQNGGQPQGMDEKSRAAIKQGLADLGIQVDDKQLEDPAFLMDMLRLLRSMPVQALPKDGQAQAQAPDAPVDGTAATAGTAADTQSAAPAGAAAQIAPAADGTTQAAQAAAAPTEMPAAQAAKTQGETPRPLTRQELARLIEGRIAGLERADARQAGHIPVSAQAPTVTPKEWQGVQARPQAEGPNPDPLPLADLDRLRVMQASALQAAAPKQDASGPRTALVLESDSAEPVSGSAAASPAEAGREAPAAQDQDAQTDLFGQGGDQTAGTLVPASKDGAAAAKDGAAGAQFHQVLEQARSIDHRAALGAGAEPRPSVHNAAILDQIARKMSATAHKSGDEISIQLTPEHMGKVRVNLEMKEDGMSARISVENDSVRRQVESNLASLKDALKDQGIQLQGLEVSVDQRHASLFNPDGSNAESFFRRQGRGDAGGNAGAESDAASLEAAPESDTGRRWGYNTLEYIG